VPTEQGLRQVTLLAQVHSCEARELSPSLQQMLAGCIGRVEHLLGVNFYEAEEISQGEKHLMIAKDLLKEHHIERMDCLNHLAMIWFAFATLAHLRFVKFRSFRTLGSTNSHLSARPHSPYCATRAP